MNCPAYNVKREEQLRIDHKYSYCTKAFKIFHRKLEFDRLSSGILMMKKRKLFLYMPKLCYTN